MLSEKRHRPARRELTEVQPSRNPTSRQVATKKRDLGESLVMRSLADSRPTKPSLFCRYWSVPNDATPPWTSAACSRSMTSAATSLPATPLGDAIGPVLGSPANR